MGGALIGWSVCALAIALQPARLQIGSTAEARVTVSNLPHGARDVRLWTSLGTASEAHVAGDGRVEAVYRAPASGPPAYGVIAAWDEASGEAAVATVELEARIEIPVETEPRAQVVVSVAGRRASARADAHGHAVALLSVPPGTNRAHVTAQDAAGNRTSAEVPFEVPPPERVWLVERAKAGKGGGAGEASLFVLSLGDALPRVEAPGAELTVQPAGPGVLAVTLRGHGPIVVTARVPDGTARRELDLGAPPPPLPPEVIVVEVPLPRFADPRDDLGASVGARLSGSFTDAAAAAEWRRRLRGSRFHLGIDLGGLYGSGNGSVYQVQLGGAFARAVGEARFSLAEKVAITVGAGLGGALVGEQRTSSSGAQSSAVDGGPSVGAQAGLLTRLGPGLLAVTVGFFYTPLLGLARAILDGAVLSVGYRAIRLEP
jgi:hypothetical protein